MPDTIPRDAMDAPEESAGEGGFLETINGVLEHAALIVRVAAVVAIVTGAILFFGRSEYTAEASFVPEASASQGSLNGLVAQFGFGGTGDDPTETPDFYADLMKSRVILDPILQSKFTEIDGRDTTTGSLLDILDVRGKTPALRLENGVRELKKMIVVSTNRRTSVIHLAITSENARLSKDIVQRMVLAVGDFNLNKRQSRARVERAFLDERVTLIKGELRVAEDALQQFVEEHRQYRSSPSQVFVADRLEREVKERESIYATLLTSLERSRVDEVRRTPVITIVDSAIAPARRDAKGTIAFTAAVSIASVIVTVVLLLAYEWLINGVADGDPERAKLYERLLHLRERAGAILRRLPGIGKRFRPTPAP